MDNALPDLPGFDTQAALKLLNNNPRLYNMILKRFRTQYAAVFAGLSATLKGTDWEIIQREAHTIKGLAGNIGHPALREAALALELSLKDAASPDTVAVGALADKLLSSLSSVLDTLGRAYPELQ